MLITFAVCILFVFVLEIGTVVAGFVLKWVSLLIPGIHPVLLISHRVLQKWEEQFLTSYSIPVISASKIMDIMHNYSEETCWSQFFTETCFSGVQLETRWPMALKHLWPSMSGRPLFILPGISYRQVSLQLAQWSRHNTVIRRKFWWYPNRDATLFFYKHPLILSSASACLAGT